MQAYLPQKIQFNNEDSTVLETFRENYSILEEKAAVLSDELESAINLWVSLDE